MKKLDTKGFTLIEVVLVVFVLGLVGGTGWYVWKQGQQKPKASNSPTTQENSNSTSSTKHQDTAEKRAWNGTISEWGVSITLRDADKVAYTYTAVPNGSYYGASYDSNIEIVLKDEKAASENCGNSLGALLRSKDKPEITDVNGHPSISNFKQVGSYYYFTPGGDSSCSDNKEHNELLKRVELDLLNIK